MKYIIKVYEDGDELVTVDNSKSLLKQIKDYLHDDKESYQSLSLSKEEKEDYKPFVYEITIDDYIRDTLSYDEAYKASYRIAFEPKGIINYGADWDSYRTIKDLHWLKYWIEEMEEKYNK